MCQCSHACTAGCAEVFLCARVLAQSMVDSAQHIKCPDAEARIVQPVGGLQRALGRIHGAAVLATTPVVIRQCRQGERQSPRSGR
jgi:hypothetical protein